MNVVTERDLEVLCDLVYVCDAHLPNNIHGYQSPCPQTTRGDGASPLDCGGSNGSDHSYRLTKLARRGYAEHRQRGAEWGDVRTGNARGSKVYRPTDKGRKAVKEWLESKKEHKR
jgi:hypothetical protein